MYLARGNDGMEGGLISFSLNVFSTYNPMGLVKAHHSVTDMYMQCLVFLLVIDFLNLDEQFSIVVKFYCY